MRRVGNRARRWLIVASVVGAVLPVLIATGRAVAEGWVPVGDNAFPTLRAWDVLTTHPPMLGTRSSASEPGLAVSHPGPLEFVALAPWVRMFGLSMGTALGVACLNVAAIVTGAWLAFRRGGPVATAATMAVMASLAWSMGRLVFDPWPPHVTVLPFAVVLLAGWSVADGDLAALPVLALSASFVLQTHLGYVLLVPGVVATSVGMLAWQLIRTRRKRVEQRSRSWRRWGALAFGFGLLSWLPPLWEQFNRPKGNLAALLVAYGDRKELERLPLSWAIRLLAGTLALPPWWLPPSFGSPALDDFGRGVSLPVAIGSLALVTTLLVVGRRRASRRGSTTVSRGLAFGTAALVLTLATMTYAPAPVMGLPVAYLRYAWVTSAFVGLQLVLALVDELRHLSTLGSRYRRAALPAFASAAVVAGLLASLAISSSATARSHEIEATKDLAAQVIPALRGQGPVLVEVNSPMLETTSVSFGMLVELQEAGVPFVLRDPSLVRQLGNHRAYDGSNAKVRLTLQSGALPMAPTRQAQVVGVIGSVQPDGDAEVRRLEDDLRAAIQQANGIPFAFDPSLWVVERYSMTSMIGRLEPLTDPDELLGSNDLVDLFRHLELASVDVDDVIDPTSFPTAKLRRYMELTSALAPDAMTAYLDSPPPLAPEPAKQG